MAWPKILLRLKRSHTRKLPSEWSTKRSFLCCISDTTKSITEARFELLNDEYSLTRMRNKNHKRQRRQDGAEDIILLETEWLSLAHFYLIPEYILNCLSDIKLNKIIIWNLSQSHHWASNKNSKSQYKIYLKKETQETLIKCLTEQGLLNALLCPIDPKRGKSFTHRLNLISPPKLNIYRSSSTSLNLCSQPSRFYLLQQPRICQWAQPTMPL